MDYTASQVPLSIEFSSQEYWSELSCPPPEDLPDPGTEPISLAYPASAGVYFATAPLGKSNKSLIYKLLTSLYCLNAN